MSKNAGISLFSILLKLTLLLTLLGTACSSNIAVDPPEEYVTSTPISVVVASPTLHGDLFPTATAIPATATPILMPESATGEPVVPAIPPIRVNFDPGTTSTTIEGSVGMNGAIPYLLGANAGQIMSVNLTGEDIALEIIDPTGTYLLPLQPSPTAWRGLLPANGDYTVRVVSILGAFDKPYTLFIEIVDNALPTGDCFGATVDPQIGNACFYFRGDPDPISPATLNVNQIEIVNSLNATVQIINVPLDTATPLNPDSLVVADMNYDGYADFRFIEFLPAGANVPYLFYIYDPATSQFIFNEAYRPITAPQFLDDGRILSNWRASAGNWGIDTYTLHSDTPQLTQREEWNVNTDGNLHHTITTFDPATGTSTIIFDEIITSE